MYVWYNHHPPEMVQTSLENSELISFVLFAWRVEIEYGIKKYFQLPSLSPTLSEEDQNLTF